MPRIAAGVYFTELDFTEAAIQLGLTRLCVVGGASKGPVNTPVQITSEPELIENFGNPLENDDGLISAIQFLKKGNNLVYMRVAHDGDYEAADYPVPGTTGGTPAVAAAGEIGLVAQVNDGDTVVVNDGQSAVAASGDITFTGSIQPTDGDKVHIDDGEGVEATGSLAFASTPSTGDTVTITDGEGDSDIYEFTDGGAPATPGAIGVDKSTTSTGGADELVTAINGSGTVNVAAGAYTGTGPWIVPLTYGITGVVGNATVIAASAAQPTITAMSGGDHGIMLEFDDDASVDTGSVSVDIGATVVDTLANVIQAINGQQSAGNIAATAADTTVTDEKATVTCDQPGTVGNSGTMTSTGTTPPAVSASLSGGSAGGSTTFEFDSNGSWVAGNVPVLIGADAASSCVNLISAINSSALQVTATYDTTTIPKAVLTNDVPGDAGNQPITESTSAARIGVSGMTGGVDAIAGAISTVMTVIAKSPGTWGNSVYVVLAQTTILGAPSTNFDIQVMAPVDNSGTLGTVERFTNLSLDPNDDRYAEVIVEDGKKGEVNASKYIELDVLEDNATVTPGTYQLGTGGGTSGTNGVDTLVYSDYVGTVSGTGATGLQSLRNPEAVEFNVMSIPSVTHWSVIEAGLALANLRGDFVYLIDTPFDLSPEQAIDWSNGDGGTHGIPNPPTSPIDDSYGVIYTAWAYVYDEYNKKYRYVPPCSYAGAEYADNDNQRGPWFIPAGEVRGVFEYAEGITYSPSPDERRDMMEGQNRVNPTVVLPEVEGIVLYGNRTTLRTESYFSDIHIRRMMIHAEKLCVLATRKIVFDPNDPITWKKIEMKCNPILEAIAAARGLDEFVVICDGTTTTDEMRGERRVKAKIRMVPIPGAEAIELEFSLFRSGGDFPAVA